MTDLVSIILPAWNSEKTLTRALNSIRNQTYHHFEALIIDDCSKDNTSKLIQEFVDIDSRFSYLKTKVNSGAGVARNLGLDKAKGRFIAFLDADDEWLPKKLEIQLNFMLNNKIYFSFTEYQRISEKMITHVSAPSTVSSFLIKTSNYIGCLTVVIDTRYTGDLKMSIVRKRQDWLTWIGLIEVHGPAKLLKAELAKYHVQEDSLSSKKWLLLSETWKVYRRHLSLGIIDSIIFMILFLLVHSLKKCYEYLNKR